jgi:competence ComEA-like helix-hairpin-helix protein
MTQRAECVEPPFARRHVQLTVAVIASAALIWLLISSWSASPRSQHIRLLDGGELVELAAGKTSLIQIDLNTAEPRELALLPRVGPILARRIVDNRDRLGPFGRVDDLRRVHGIGPKTLAEIRHICIVDSLPRSEQTGQRLASSAREVDDPDR